MDWIAYLRVSTTQQGQSGLGLAAQKDIVMRFIGNDPLLKTVRRKVRVLKGCVSGVRRLSESRNSNARGVSLLAREVARRGVALIAPGLFRKDRTGRGRRSHSFAVAYSTP